MKMQWHAAVFLLSAAGTVLIVRPDLLSVALNNHAPTKVQSFGLLMGVSLPVPGSCWLPAFPAEVCPSNGTEPATSETEEFSYQLGRENQRIIAAFEQWYHAPKHCREIPDNEKSSQCIAHADAAWREFHKQCSQDGTRNASVNHCAQ